MEIIPVPEEVKNRVNTALTEAVERYAIEIKTSKDYVEAQTLLKMVKDKIKQITEDRMSITRLQDEAKARTIAFFAPALDRLEKAKNYLNAAILKYHEEQRKIQEEEERKLREQIEAKKKEQAVDDVFQVGEPAPGMKSEPVYVPPVKTSKPLPKTDSYVKEIWSAEVTDLKSLVRAVANEKVPLECLKPDMVFLNQQAVKLKESLSMFPGVRAVCKKTVVSR